MRGDFTLTILKIGQLVSYTTTNILDTISYFGYIETYRRMKGFKTKTPIRKIPFKKTVWKIEERQRILKLLYKLRKEGLINITKKGENKIWKTTKKGEEKIESLENKLFIKPNYEVQNSKQAKIIAFDIPEKERIKRNWLRMALKQLKFKMVQKSVWIGNSILPEDFLIDLQKLDILPYLEIFAVTKSGTLKQIQ